MSKIAWDFVQSPGGVTMLAFCVGYGLGVLQSVLQALLKKAQGYGK